VNDQKRQKEVEEILQETFDSLGEKNGLSEFFSQAGSTITELLGKDLLFRKHKFYSLEVDKRVHSKINKFSIGDPILNILAIVNKALDRKRDTLSIQKLKLQEETESLIYKKETQQGPDRKNYYKANRNLEYGEKLARMRADLSDLQVKEKRLYNERLNFRKSQKNLKHYIKTSTVYEKPNSIDISAQIKIYSQFDVDGLFKL
jgi:hypothetical protein